MKPTEEQIKDLEHRLRYVEGILSVLISNNYHNLVGGKEWAERCAEILNRTSGR